MVAVARYLCTAVLSGVAFAAIVVVLALVLAVIE